MKEDRADIKKAIKKLLPKTIDRELLQKAGCDLGTKGRVSAAQGLAMALITKALEGDMKAFSIISELEDNETSEGKTEIVLKVVE